MKRRAATIASLMALFCAPGGCLWIEASGTIGVPTVGKGSGPLIQGRVGVGVHEVEDDELTAVGVTAGFTRTGIAAAPTSHTVGFTIRHERGSPDERASLRPVFAVHVDAWQTTFEPPEPEPVPVDDLAVLGAILEGDIDRARAMTPPPPPAPKRRFFGSVTLTVGVARVSLREHPDPTDGSSYSPNSPVIKSGSVGASMTLAAAVDERVSRGWEFAAFLGATGSAFAGDDILADD